MRAQVSIDFSEGSAQTYLGDATLPIESNISNGDEIFDAPASFGYKGFQLSAASNSPVSALDGTYKLFDANGYPGLVSKSISNSEGNFQSGYFWTPVTVTFYISGGFPTIIYVEFDKDSGEYATEWLLRDANDELLVFETSYKYDTIIINTHGHIPDNTDTIKLSLQIYSWSKPYKSVKITRIATAYNKEFTGRDLISMECSENLFDAQLKIAPGICEQYADISIYDRDGFLHRLAETEFLMSDKRVTITAIDDDLATTYTLGTYVASDWNIQGTQSEVGITCRDKSYVFEKINLAVPAILDRSVNDMLELVFAQAGNVPWRYLSVHDEQHCKNIITPDNWFYGDTLYATLEKICQLGMLRIYWYIDAYVVGVCY